MSLANDKARCHDEACPDSPICQRFTERRTGRVQQATFRKPGAASCDSLILDTSPHPFGKGSTYSERFEA